MIRRQQYLFGCVFLLMIWLVMMNRSVEINVTTEEVVESEFEEIYYEREEYFKRFNLQEVRVLYKKP
jgi:hypothetical protein